MAHPRGVKRTGFGVFMKACWKENFENEPFQFNKKKLEKFHDQCSVWWYNLSPQEVDQFNNIAQNANKQNIALSEAYNANMTGLPTFDTQFSDSAHVLNYTNRADNSVKSMMKNTEQFNSKKSDTSCKVLSNRNKKYPSDFHKSTLLNSKALKNKNVGELTSKTTDPHNNIKSKFIPPSKILSLPRNMITPSTGQALNSCEDVADRIIRQIGLARKKIMAKEGAKIKCVQCEAVLDETDFNKHIQDIHENYFNKLKNIFPSEENIEEHQLNEDGFIDGSKYSKDNLHPLENVSDSDKCDNELQSSLKSQIGQTFSQENCREIASRITRQIGLVSKKKLPRDSIKIKCVYCEAVLDETDLSNHIQDVHPSYFFKLVKVFPRVKENIKDGRDRFEPNLPTGEQQFSEDEFIEESTIASKQRKIETYKTDSPKIPHLQ